MYNNDGHSDLFRGIIEQSSDLFCVTESDYSIVDTNVSFRTYFGDNNKKKQLFEVISFHYQEEFSFTTKLFEQSNNQYIFINWQKKIYENNSTILWFGKIDINKKMNSLREISRIGKIGFWEYDIKTQTVFWSEEVYKIHEEPLEKNIEISTGINYYHPDDISIISELFSRVLNEGIPFEVELRIITPNNNIKWIKSIGERVSENGEPIKIKGTFQDIHRRKTAELKLVQNTMLLEQILDSLPVGIFWKDKYGVYQGFNKRSTDFIGLSTEKLIGRTDKDLIADPTLLNKILQQDQDILTNQKVHSEIRNVKLSRKTIRSIELKKLPLYNEKKETFGILGVYIDNTELITSIRSLESKNNELNELLFATSHDLKEPLQGINRYAQLLKRSYHEALETHGNQMLEYILREAKRQYQQFNGLTRFLEIGNQNRLIKKLNLNNVINDSINNVDFEQYSFPEFKVIFDNLPEVFYNEYDLEVVFYELINNAIKFRTLNQTLIIKISAIENTDDFQIIFTDNGEGFDINLKDKVFMIFQKLHNKYYYEGAGIGLSICKKIVENYGGQIEVLSEKLKGTTFKFTIPKTILQKENLLGS